MKWWGRTKSLGLTLGQTFIRPGQPGQLEWRQTRKNFEVLLIKYSWTTLGGEGTLENTGKLGIMKAKIFSSANKDWWAEYGGIRPLEESPYSKNPASFIEIPGFQLGPDHLLELLKFILGIIFQIPAILFHQQQQIMKMTLKGISLSLLVRNACEIYYWAFF